MLAARMPCRVSPPHAAPVNAQCVVGPTRRPRSLYALCIRSNRHSAQETNVHVLCMHAASISGRRKARGTNANVDSCKG